MDGQMSDLKRTSYLSVSEKASLKQSTMPLCTVMHFRAREPYLEDVMPIETGTKSHNA